MIDGFKKDRRGRSTGVPIDKRAREWGRPPQDSSWCWFTREMLASPAFRALSPKAVAILMRAALEHVAHGGSENGALVLTYNDALRDCSISNRNAIAQAFRELDAVGFLKAEVRGGRSFGDIRRPSRFRLTWLPAQRPDLAPPTNEWKAFESRESALAAIASAEAKATIKAPKKQNPGLNAILPRSQCDTSRRF